MPESREESDGVTPLCAGDPLAGALARLAPAPPGFDRDSLLFAAGQAAQAGTSARDGGGPPPRPFSLPGAWGYTLLEPAVPTRSSSPTANAPAGPKLTPAPAPLAEPDESAAAPLLVTFEKEYDPGDRIRGLRLRNDILIAGLGVIPSAVSAVRPQDPTDTSWAEVEKKLGLQPGSFAIPMAPMPERKQNPDEPEMP